MTDDWTGVVFTVGGFLAVFVAGLACGIVARVTRLRGEGR
jgi:hypothetical protein